MNNQNKFMCKCGHTKWDHAISLKGVIGGCQYEIIKEWEWCECEQFEVQTKEDGKKDNDETA